MKKKFALMAASLVLVAALAVGGTLAYLTAKTEAVVNTFTVGNVGKLTLEEESGTLVEGKRQHIIVPGTDTEKDPKVTYTPNSTSSEAVYVFVKIDAVGWSFDSTNNKYTLLYNNAETLTWSVDSAWTAVTGYPGVYYIAVAANTSLSATSVIAGDVIQVNGTNVTQDNIQAVATAAGELTFTAYAIQQAGFVDTNGDPDVAAAWQAVTEAYTASSANS